MCERSCVPNLKLIVNNSREIDRGEYLLGKAVQAYWQACESGMYAQREAAAIEFLLPLRARSPRGLVQKVQILESMIATQRPAETIAEFAASVASDALTMSRNYLSRASLEPRFAP
jgi:hypothetical protein